MAQDTSSFEVVDAEVPDLDEQLRASPAISGARIIGVVRANISGARTKPNFFLRVPDSWSEDTVCLRVVSADALYEAKAGYSIAEDRAGERVSLKFDTQNHDFWNAIEASDVLDSISALATRGSCDTPREDAIAIPVEIGAPSVSDEVSIFLNTFRSEAAFIEWGGQEFDCEPVDAIVRTAFDMRCKIDLTSANEAEVKLSIYPIRSGEIGRPMSAWLIK